MNKDEISDWLLEAAEEIGTWGRYADDYYRKKWDLKGTVETFRQRARMVKESLDK